MALYKRIDLLGSSPRRSVRSLSKCRNGKVFRRQQRHIALRARAVCETGQAVNQEGHDERAVAGYDYV
jgi:hypothetical protein